MKYKIHKIFCILGIHKYVEYPIYTRCKISRHHYTMFFHRYKNCIYCDKTKIYDQFIDDWKNVTLNKLPIKLRRKIKLKKLKISE